MNNTDQAFIEAYREGKADSSPNVKVLKADDMAKVIGANSPIELSFDAPSTNVVLQSAPPRKGLPLNRKHSKHRNAPAPHAADLKGMAEAAESVNALQNAIATGNDMATDAGIANSKLADALPPDTVEATPATQPIAEPQVEAPVKSEATPAPAAEPASSEAEPVILDTKQTETPAAENVASPTEEKPAETKLEPMWEVDQFEWSEVCERIHAAGAGVLPNLKWIMACEPKVLAIGSIRRHSGATTAACCLARHFASTGRDVLLIDADFENPSLAEQLGVKAPACWREKMQAGESVAKSSITSIDDQITILPLHEGERLDESLSAEAEKMLADASRLYDLTIVDIGVIAEDSSQSLWAPTSCFGGVLVVRDLRHDDDKSVAAILQSVRSIGENVAVIENFAE